MSSAAKNEDVEHREQQHNQSHPQMQDQLQQQPSVVFAQSLNLANKLKEQNEQLKLTYTQLSREYKCLEEELDVCEQEKNEAVECKKSMEIECHNLYKRWNEQLKIQQTQFANIQQQMVIKVPNKELEMLRVQILQELEQSYREKMSFLQSELNKQRALNESSFHELEILKVKHEQTVEHFEVLIKDKHKIYQDNVNELRTNNQELHELMENENGDQSPQNLKIRELQYKVTEYEEKIKFIEKSFNEHKEKHSQFMMDSDNKESAFLMNEQKLNAKLMMKGKECQGYVDRNTDLKKELEFHRDLHMSTENQLQKIEGNVSQYKNSIQSKQKQIKLLEERLIQNQKEMRVEHNQKTDALKKSIKEVSENLSNLSAIKDKLQYKLENIDTKYNLELTNLKYTHSQEMNLFLESKNDLESKYQKTQSEHQQLKISLNKMENESKKQMSEQEFKISELKNELEMRSENNRNVENENKKLVENNKLLKCENIDLNQELNNLQNKYRTMLTNKNDLLTDCKKYQKMAEYLETDLESVSSQIQKMSAESQRKYETLKKEHSEYRRATKADLSKLKKEKLKYKKLAASAKMKITSLMKEVKKIQSQYKSELKLRSKQMGSVSKQLKDVERERDDIKFRLTMDAYSFPSSAANNHHNNNNNNNNMHKLSMTAPSPLVVQGLSSNTNHHNHMSHTQHSNGHSHGGRHTVGVNADLISTNVDMLLKELEFEKQQQNDRSTKLFSNRNADHNIDNHQKQNQNQNQNQNISLFNSEALVDQNR